MTFIPSRRDPSISAIVVSTRQLHYLDGPDASLDRPAHVRASSSIDWLADHLVVIQDDANFIAVVDPYTWTVDSIPLPVGADGLRQFDDIRGNKRFKLDLETCVTIPFEGEERLLAFGSGSTTLRQTIVVLDPNDLAAPRVVAADSLYDSLRRQRVFSGSELNIEGAVYLDGVVRLFNRGNGTIVDGMVPVNATCDLDVGELMRYLRSPDTTPVPTIGNVLRYELEHIGDLQLGFTDAAATSNGIMVAMAAEDSPDATRDGRVSGSAIGIIDAEEVRWIELTRPEGTPYLGKVEGICPIGDGSNDLYCVVDCDDPGTPSELCVVQLVLV